MLASTVPAKYIGVVPSRNRVKNYLPESYYHVYSRGVERRNIFVDKQDYVVFLSLLKRYLSGEEARDFSGRLFEDLSQTAELLAYCLMPTHIHLLLYQKTEDAMTRLLRRIMTSYSMYFNKRYQRLGPLFQDRYKASLISKDEYLQHVSRYIHLNPKKNYETWEFSSLSYYLGRREAVWLRPGKILGFFGPGEYGQFVADYEDHKKMLDEIKSELADSNNH